MSTDQHTLSISLEDVGNLRRMHTQQFRRLMHAKATGDGPAAGGAVHQLVSSHLACRDLLDILEYMLTTWTPPEQHD